MIFIILIIFGLVFGSFVNALIWRIYQQDEVSINNKSKPKAKNVDLSIVKGRSVCVHCNHELAAIDLIPVFSWLYLRGKCRYCHKPIDDSPIIELATMALFISSYLFWPYQLNSLSSQVGLVLWQAIVVGLVALFVYDFKHLILPNRIIFPLYATAITFRISLLIALNLSFAHELYQVLLGALVGGGFFYLLYQVSAGRWIGGGDVKLGYLIGIVLGPINSLVGLISAFYIAAFTILPLMIAGRVTRKSKIPFGPFLIVGLVISMFWGDGIRQLYMRLMGF